MHAIARKVRSMLNRAGYDIVRKRDPFRLDVYRSIYSEDLLLKRPFYNVGSGDFHHPYWTNIDFKSEWYGADRDVVHHDLTSLTPLPIADAGAKIIYSSHTIEHVPDEAANFFLTDAHRALEVGGVLRITTGPDAETDYRALQLNDDDWFYWDKENDTPGRYEASYRAPPSQAPLEERWLHHVASSLAPNNVEDHPKVSAAQLRELFAENDLATVLDMLAAMVKFNPKRPGNHVSWWTHAKLEQKLRDAGFQTVYRSGYQQSASPLMRRSPLFDSTHPQISIYMEAIR